MMSAALLLEEGGAMNNKPELEIFADDVQCAHGATCGQLDEDMLFYLMARGLPRKEAERLLVQAFLGEALEFVENESRPRVAHRHGRGLAEGSGLIPSSPLWGGDGGGGVGAGAS